MARVLPLVLVALLSCKSGSSDGRTAPPAHQKSDAGAATTGSGSPAAEELLRCERRSFEMTVDVPEVSGAVHERTEFGAVVWVVGDSGTRGAYAAIDAESGKKITGGRLPLDPAAGDDLEGFAFAGARYYALTSSGFMTEFRRNAREFVRDGAAYPIGGKQYLCDRPTRTNCGKNFEGLCVRESGSGGCDGYAASKVDGHLHCLRRGDDGLVATGDRIEVADGGVLTGCAFLGADRVLAGTNLLGGNRVYLVSNLAGKQAVRVESLGTIGPGFGEAIAASARGDLYRFSDTGAAVSLMNRYYCQ